MKFALSEADVKDLNDEQQNAIFEAMVTAVLADGNVNKPEIEKFEEEIGEVPWGKDLPALGEMIRSARERVTALKSEADVLAFIDAIAGKLPAQELREKVLRMMCAVMYSDREVNQEERNVIAAFAMAFEIPRDRLETISDEVKASN